MQVYVVAVKDNGVQAFMHPTHVHHTAAAVRSFGDAVRDPQHEFSKHPEDFDLYLLSVFDDLTGQFTRPDAGPERLVRGLDMVSKS